MLHQYDDGGRADAGYKGKAGDCVVRAISIVANLPYQEVYDELRKRNANFANNSRSRIAKRIKQRGATSRNGNFKKIYSKYLEDLGFKWTATMQIGKGCTTHMNPDELPAGRIVVRLSKHIAAVMDGVLHDTRDCSRDETRCVYGYWSQ